ncbi:MAG: electron transfer flavoprotein subunit alpha/FixB family protein [Desulfobacterales bacterium]|nr:electron transfer flavoprotein subunit alpha/FixB family protein [Desulfobacterales bacterium]
MGKIAVHQEKIDNHEELIELCPFDSIEVVERAVSGAGADTKGYYAVKKELVINESCKVCKLCVKNGPEGVFEFIEEAVAAIDKSLWRGIAVYVDHGDGEIHPVTYELIGKARAMAAKIDHPVYCVFMGHNIKERAADLLRYGVDEVFLYDQEELAHFRIEPYAAVLEDFLDKLEPSIMLIGGTTVGRSLAPRVAARFRTGLTADCTILDVQENTDLDQIRPAFGGNIMAHIYTPNHRPQFATVRYKIFSAPECLDKPDGKITLCEIAKRKLASKIKVLEVKRKEKVETIEEAEVIVAAGRGVQKEEDMAMIYDLAKLLGAKIGTTRPLIEAGWADARNQIGLSGRTVKPKLIISCGISGAIQWVAGMNNSDCIVAINTDEKAPVFEVADYAIVGDIYEVVPKLIDKIAAYEGYESSVECKI